MAIVGLFHAAISQSGTALGMWAWTPRAIAQRRANILGELSWCSTESSEALVNCLKKLSPEELALAHHKFYVSSALIFRVRVMLKKF